MTHQVDGLTLRYTSRTSWKAEVRYGGWRVIAPVTWTKGQRRTDGEVFQEVWFQKADELEEYRTRREPYIVVVAIAKDYNKHPHEFLEFRQVLEVQSTGTRLSDHSIEARVIHRVNGKTVNAQRAQRREETG